MSLYPLPNRVWHLVSRLLGIETFLNFLRVSVSVSKIWVSKKVSVSGLKIFGLKKSLGIGLKNIWSRKKSRYRSRKYLVSKKSLSLGLENFGLKKSLGIGLDEIFWSRHSVLINCPFGRGCGVKSYLGNVQIDRTIFLKGPRLFVICCCGNIQSKRHSSAAVVGLPPVLAMAKKSIRIRNICNWIHLCI